MKCQDCEFFREDTCKKGENYLTLMDDPVCLQKLTVMLLRDIAYLLDDSD